MATLLLWLLVIVFVGAFAAQVAMRVRLIAAAPNTFSLDDPGFRIALHQKDLAIALASATELGVALPGSALAQELFNACRARGGEGWDHSALVRALEALADHALGE